jgi:hypothetical protein
MSLFSRLAVAVCGAIAALHASATPIELTPQDLTPAAPFGGAPLGVWFAEDKVSLVRAGDIQLDAAWQVAPAVPAMPPQFMPPLHRLAPAPAVPEPVHYKLLLAGVALLLLCSARRGRHAPWRSIRVGQADD